MKKGVIRHGRSHSSGSAIEPRVTEDADRRGGNAEAHESSGISLRDRGCGRDAGISRGEQLSRGPPKSSASGRHGTGNHGNRNPPVGGTRRQLGPEVEFRENEKIGSQRFEQRADIARQIIGQVSRRVHGKTSRQRLCGRAEVRVDELANGTDSAQCVDDALCLEALADRGGVEPDEWSRRVSMETRPFVEPGCRVAARARYRRRRVWVRIVRTTEQRRWPFER